MAGSPGVDLWVIGMGGSARAVGIRALGSVFADIERELSVSSFFSDTLHPKP